MFKSFKRQKAIEIVLILVAAFIVFILVKPSFAQFEANRAPLAYAGGGIRFLSASATTPSGLPKGYTLWSGDGAEFWITRYAALATLESVPLKVPAATSITITSPPMFYSNGYWYQMAILNLTAVTDSVYVLPLDK